MMIIEVKCLVEFHLYVSLFLSFSSNTWKIQYNYWMAQDIKDFSQGPVRFMKQCLIGMKIIYSYIIANNIGDVNFLFKNNSFNRGLLFIKLYWKFQKKKKKILWLALFQGIDGSLWYLACRYPYKKANYWDDLFLISKIVIQVRNCVVWFW